jgi:VPDSG-CTERM motif
MAAITFALVTQPVLAQNHQLVITEASSSSLSATYDGNPLIFAPLAPDSWLAFTTITTSAPVFWIEPENPLLANEFSVSPPFGFVFSDSTVNEGATAEPDGFTFVGAGMDATGALVDVTFHDNAAGTEVVPDAGATCSLFAVSLMGLAFLRRKF